MFTQLVTPNTNAQDGAGMCLAFAQKVYNAPIRYRSAWEAWEAVPDKHDDAFPEGVSVPVWFSHFGTYQGIYANWGHVVAKIGDRFLSSPASGYGQKWLNSIEEVERTYNCKLVGWSESLNGLKIVEWSGSPAAKEEEEMKVIRSQSGRVALVGEFVVVEYTNDKDKSWNGGVNTKAFGEAKNFTEEEFQSLIDQATERRISLVREIKK
jgi:hypothetical protein